MADTPQPQAAAAPETRNARGEWRPKNGIVYAPLLQWPWKPGDLSIPRGSIDPSLASIRVGRLRDAARERGCTLLLVFQAGSEQLHEVKSGTSDWSVR